MKSKNKLILIVIGFIIVFGAFIFLSNMVSQEIQDFTGKPVHPVEQIADDQTGQGSDLFAVTKNILRIERKLPQNEYSESVVLADKREVARYKSKNNKIFDESGHIPDGKVKFVNEWKNTYGFEHYRHGKRDGAYIEYYKNGNIKIEAQYQQGRLLKKKTYYLSKVLMKEEDLSTSQFISQLQSFGKFEKIGKGKFYRQDGSLKQEWSFADDSQQYYLKLYDEEGELTEAQYYDNQGELVENRTVQQEMPLKAAQIEPVEGLN